MPHLILVSKASESSPSDENISIVAMVNYGINAS
jgi:hypothetical protein